MPMAAKVSLTQGGLTTLTRMLRGFSKAAGLAKPSSPECDSFQNPWVRIRCEIAFLREQRNARSV
jgi:hypothetical protein